MSERWQGELERYGKLQPPDTLRQRVQRGESEWRTTMPTAEPRRRLPAAILALLVAGASVLLVFRAFGGLSPERSTLGSGQVVDGKIAFVSDGINLINPDGTDSQKIRETPPPDFDTFPVWSPDGTRMAFLHRTEGDSELLVFDMASGSVTKLEGQEFRIVSHPVWSPDGTRIAFDSGNDVYLINADGIGATKLTSGAFPTWSPDGSRIAFESQRGISVVNVDGSGETEAAAPGVFPAWSPSGTKIAFIDNDVLQLSVVNADGTGLTQLTHISAVDDIGPPAWSPDGSQIAFQALRGDGNYNIYLVNADGTGFTDLTGEPGDENIPTWSPDGTKIAFIAGKAVSENPGNFGTFDVYVMDSDGTNKTRVTEGAGPAYSLSWQSVRS
jgi:Tol biopolymer transport system component